MERRVSIRLPDVLLREIDRRARRRNLRRSDIIREALLTIMPSPDETLDRRPIDRVRRWVGSVKGLPPDLASNPEKYLKCFSHDRP